MFSLFRRRRPSDMDLDDEIRFHLAREIELRESRGMPRAEAERSARLALGSPALVKERTRAVWIWTALEQLLQDLRFGSRILTKSPGVSATAVILVALVIGGNTTIFSIAHGILNKPMPGVHATGLMTLSWVAEDGFIETHNGYPVYQHFLEHATTLQPAAFDFQRATMTDGNGSHAVRMGMVSANYFETLGVRLAKGRSFTPDEAGSATTGFVLAAVISHHLWQNTFQGSDDVLGRPLILNGRPATVIGVAGPDFRGAILGEASDLWVPVAAGAQLPERLQADRTIAVSMIGRLAPGRSSVEALAELTTLWHQVQTDPSVTGMFRLRLVPYSATAGGNSLVSTYGSRMLAIFSVVTLLTVAIVCANVANLLIARAIVRQREIALRQSLGASHARIVRALLAEGLVLSILAWTAACLFAWWISKAATAGLLDEVESPGQIVLPDLTPDWAVVGYALTLAILCTISFTIAPALRTWRQQLLPFLKVGEQGVVPARSRLSRGLVVIQLAFSVLLLTTAGLAQRSLSLSTGFDVGFPMQNLLLATVNTAGSAEPPESNRGLVQALEARLARLPAVDGVSHVPGTRLWGWLNFPVRRDRSSDRVMAIENRVGSGFFAAIGVPFVAGRDFDGRTARTAIITHSLAETLWPGEPAVGKTLVAGPNDGGAGRAMDVEVIGVVRDAYFTGQPSETPPRYVFFSSASRALPPGETTFYVRYRGVQDVMAPAIARAVREVDMTVPLADLRSLETEVARQMAPIRMVTSLITLFAGLSLLIASIGQYAIVAFDGRRRIREFGLRLALGASSDQVLRSVLGETLRSTAAGAAIGFLLSVGVGAALARLLYGITPTDPLIYGGVLLLLSAASLLACYLPARRAARVDPIEALRTE